MAIIPNTLELTQLWVTNPLAEEARQRPNLSVAGDGRALPFDSAGNLLQEELFPHCIRAWRRG